MRISEVDHRVGGNVGQANEAINDRWGLPSVYLPPFKPGPQYADPGGWIRLSLSESFLGCSPMARDAAASVLHSVHSYPDPGARSLIAALAAMHGVTSDHLVVGNGVDELLLLSAVAFASPDSEVVVTNNTYQGHANAAAAARRPATSVPLRGLRVDVAGVIDRMCEGSLVYVCNPHNPTGTALTSAEVDALASAAAENRAILVMDEAYIEYTSPGETASGLDHVRAGRPVVVLRSFSKIYGLAGLRCGYAVADPALSGELRRLKNVLVFNVNRLALAAAEASLHHGGFRQHVQEQTRAALTGFQAWLDDEAWAASRVSVTNFAMVELPWPASLATTELARRRILVRDCTDLGLPHHVRISMGRPTEMEAVKAALRHTAGRLSSSRSKPGGTRA